RKVSPQQVGNCALFPSRIICASQQQPTHGDRSPPCLPGFPPRAGLAVLDDGCIGEGAGKACGRGVGSRVLHLPRRVLPTSDGGSPARHRHSSLTATPVACEFTLPFVPTISGISVSAHSTGSACVYVSSLSPLS
uniref:Uncharacterized protein n=1 Tax=Aegilops tauschii subsp. strangulata TaxID=200361 RepID=A0A453EPJ4_AEGTS